MTTSAGQVLLDRLAEGDPRALEDLYDRYAGFVNALVLRIVPDAEAANGIVEAVFLQAWREATTCRTQEATLVTWLCTMARARAVARLDRWVRRDRARSRRLKRVLVERATRLSNQAPADA